MNWKTATFIAVIAYGGYNHWQKRPVLHSPGTIAIHEPIQVKSSNAQIVEKNGYQLTLLEKFDLEARVLSSSHYSMDREADLAPVDLALGWGAMSDSAVLKDIAISQSNRFYYWRVKEFPIPQHEIETHSANMHMIPADEDVEEALKAVRTGQIVSIDGYLVEAKADDGWRWRSSLTREDTGYGACELVLVKSLQVH